MRMTLFGRNPLCYCPSRTDMVPDLMEANSNALITGTVWTDIDGTDRYRAIIGPTLPKHDTYAVEKDLHPALLNGPNNFRSA